MLMPIFMVLGLWIYTRTLWKPVWTMVLAQLTVLFVLFPWAYRNHNLSGRWIFTSTSVGATLVTGLGEFRNPWGLGPTDEDRAKEAAAVGIPSPWFSDADLHFRKLFLQCIIEKPTAYLGTVVRRVPLVAAPPFTFGFSNPAKTKTFTQMREGHQDRYDVLRSQTLYFLKAYWDYLGMAALAFLCTLSVTVLCFKEWRNPIIFFLLCPHLYCISSHILTHLEPRFLLPTIFCWLFGLSYVFVLLREKRTVPKHPTAI
jgi:hypothetical protein